jgi:hypothetical protein
MSHQLLHQFRFLDLPREIRNKIYRVLLCSFAPVPTTMTIDKLNVHKILEHSVETAILRTTIQIHREAYDVMIKTNRFVFVKSAGIPIRNLLNSFLIRPVMVDEPALSDFKGYTLAVSIFRKRDQTAADREGKVNLRPYSFMLLGRDLDSFCEVLADGEVHMPGFSTGLAISITMAPMLQSTQQSQSRYKDSLTDFSSAEKTQQTLLRPFRTYLKGIKTIQVCGLVTDPVLAKTVAEEIAQDQWTNEQKVLDEITAAKDRGNKYFRKGNMKEACGAWQYAAEDVERVHGGSSWKGLVVQGGQPFAASFAALYFSLKLNIAHLFLGGIEKGFDRYPASICAFMAGSVLTDANQTLRKGYWMDDFEFRPTDAQMGKYFYRQAFCWRVSDETERMKMALIFINRALRLCPGDALILKEQQAILAWAGTSR